MQTHTQPQLNPGDVVKFRHPTDGREAAARFKVVELRGERILIQLQCDLPIPPMEAVPLCDVTIAAQ